MFVWPCPLSLRLRLRMTTVMLLSFVVVIAGVSRVVLCFWLLLSSIRSAVGFKHGWVLLLRVTDPVELVFDVAVRRCCESSKFVGCDDGLRLMWVCVSVWFGCASVFRRDSGLRIWLFDSRLVLWIRLCWDASIDEWLSCGWWQFAVVRIRFYERMDVGDSVCVLISKTSSGYGFLMDSWMLFESRLDW